MQVEFTKPNLLPVAHGRPIALLGSCFSENMVPFFESAGFAVSSNPWGTIFHPEPLVEVLSNPVKRGKMILRNDIWLSYQASGSLYGFSQSELTEKLEQAQDHFWEQLKVSSTLIITLGTAHGYQLIDSGQIVANCHKMQGATFQKVLSETIEITETIVSTVEILRNRFPELQIVLTLSPVRYKRDGWIESQRSKARLLEAIHAATERTNAIYFPAYEMVVDVLRDYHWFEEDGVHPNNAAVGKVFELFGEWFFDTNTRNIVAEADQIRRLEKHRILYPGSEEATRFATSLNEKRENFLSRHSNFIW